MVGGAITASSDSEALCCALEAIYARVKPGRIIGAASFYFCRAYKNAGIAPGRGEFGSVLPAPPPGRLLVAWHRAQPFGSSRVPANFGRVAASPK